MKLFAIITVGTALSLSTMLSAQEPLPDETINKLSYGMGRNLGQQILQNPNVNSEVLLKGFEDAMTQNVDMEKMFYADGARLAADAAQKGLKPDQVIQAIKDVAAGKPSPYTDEEIMAANQEAQRFMEQRRQQQQQNVQQMAQVNLQQGQAFLEQNAQKEGVMVTLSGLQYKVIEEGEGEKPGKESKVKVHYTGRFLNGEVFDSSVETGKPVEFALNGVIPGWTEGIQLMSPGAKYRFWIPSALAYGPRGNRGIGPNQVLDFEVELIEVVGNE